MKSLRGFTLVELMVVIAVIVILTAIGFPGIQDLRANNRLLTNANDIVISFHQARSEALKRSDTVTVSAKTGGGVTNWTKGWEVIVDGNTISDHAALHQTITSTQNGATPFATSYDYNAQGRLNITNTHQIKLCDSRTKESGRLVTLTPMGRLSVEHFVCD